jgi:hypothetical protein
MPKVSKETASDVREMGPVTDRREVMNGYTVEFVSFAADADLDGPLQALPGGMCQCPHWGYVIAGRLRREPRPRSSEDAGGSYAPPARADQQQSSPSQQPSQHSPRIAGLLSSMDVDTLY